MVRWESVVISLIGALAGAALGIGLGLALSQALADEGIKAISIPGLQVALAGADDRAAHAAVGGTPLGELLLDDLVEVEGDC